MGSQYLISLSLPKTGTTFLGSLLAQHESYQLPTMKEPSFFFTAPRTNGNVTGKIKVVGNLRRGRKWYTGLFPGPAPHRVDLSTQYWLHLDQVLANTAWCDATFLRVDRNPLDQVISYVAHLRRGYIPTDPIDVLAKHDPTFLPYLDTMFEAGELIRRRLHEDGRPTITVRFEDLTSDPERVLREQFMMTNFNLNLHATSANRRSQPRLRWVNELLFSNSVRSVGRALPNSLYGPLVAMRKRMVNRNLSESASEDSQDADFILARYGTT